MLIGMLSIIIGLLYILFLCSDISNTKIFLSSAVFKYISIILCFVITILIGEDGLNKRDRLLLQIGFFITILGDLCLLIFDYYIPGVALFCLVQIIYYNRYKGGPNHRASFVFVEFIAIFLLTVIIYYIVNLTLIKIDFLFAIAFFYAVCLILSTVESIKTFKYKLYPCYNRYMIVIGMILFLLCDISVALFNISKEFNMTVYKMSALSMWGFYLPSQFLLSISGYRFEKHKGSGAGVYENRIR